MRAEGGGSRGYEDNGTGESRMEEDREEEGIRMGRGFDP